MGTMFYGTRGTLIIGTKGCRAYDLNNKLLYEASFQWRDIEHFGNFCDAIRKGDIGFAYMVFRTFLERVDERAKMVDELLAQPQDFTTDDQMVTDRDAAQYAHTRAEALDRWRQRIKYDLLVLKGNEKEDAEHKRDKVAHKTGSLKTEKLAPEAAKSTAPVVAKNEHQEAIDKLTRRYHNIAKLMHQTSNGDLLEMYLNAFTTSFDPHTDYMSPDTQKDFDIAMSL